MFLPIRSLLTFVFSTAIVLFFLFAMALSYLKSEYAKPFLSKVIEEQLSHYTKAQVTIGTIAFAPPCTLALLDVGISESGIPLMKAEKLCISISPSELFNGIIAIETIECNALELLALPSPALLSPQTPSSSPAAKKSSLPLPVMDLCLLKEIKIHQASLSSTLLSPLSQHLPVQHLPKTIPWKATIEPHLSEGAFTAALFVGPFDDSTNASSSFQLSLTQQDGRIATTFSLDAFPLSLDSPSQTLSFQGKAECSWKDLQSLWLKNKDAKKDPSRLEMRIEAPLLLAQECRLQDISLLVSFSDLFSNYHGNLYTSIGLINGKIGAHNLTLRDLCVGTTIDRQEEQWPFLVALDHPLNSEHHALAEGQWHVDQKSCSLTFTRLEGQISSLPFAIQNALTCQWTKLGLKVDPVHVQLEDNLWQASLECDLPISFPKLHIDQTAPIGGTFTAQGEIKHVLQKVFNDTTTLCGHLEATTTLTGSLHDPRFSTLATLSNGSFENLKIGAFLTDVSASFEGANENIIMKHLSAKDSKQGILKGSGSLTLDPQQDFPFTIDCTIEQLALWDVDYAKASFTGNLSLKGTAKGATLSGNAEAVEPDIRIPDQIPALINSVDVTYVNQLEQEKKPLPLPSSHWPFGFDIHITIPDNLSVIGRDLVSKWKGNLSITGTADSPIFTGNMKVLTGQYRFNGKDFDITQGTITLEGDPDKKSVISLYVIASKDLGKVKVEVIVKGPASDPEISFRSNPPLPQREILSWILFNRGTSEISPFQGTQLTESITHLKHDHKTPDVLGKIRNLLGIDRVDISRDEARDNALNIQVGKYLSQNVYISVAKSDVNRIAVEAAVMRNIKLQAQIGDDSKGQLFLKWKHDY